MERKIPNKEVKLDVDFSVFFEKPKYVKDIFNDEMMLIGCQVKKEYKDFFYNNFIELAKKHYAIFIHDFIETKKETIKLYRNVERKQYLTKLRDTYVSSNEIDYFAKVSFRKFIIDECFVTDFYEKVYRKEKLTYNDISKHEGVLEQFKELAKYYSCIGIIEYLNTELDKLDNVNIPQTQPLEPTQTNKQVKPLTPEMQAFENLFFDKTLMPLVFEAARSLDFINKNNEIDPKKYTPHTLVAAIANPLIKHEPSIFKRSVKGDRTTKRRVHDILLRCFNVDYDKKINDTNNKTLDDNSKVFIAKFKELHKKTQKK